LRCDALLPVAARLAPAAPRRRRPAPHQSAAAPAASSDPPEDELDRAQRAVAELRASAAASAAVLARTSDLCAKGRVLQTIHIPAGSNDSHYCIADIFCKHAGASGEVVICEPYLISSWQLRNLSDFLDALLVRTHVRKVALTSHFRSQCQAQALQEMVCKLGPLGLSFSYSFTTDLHLREVSYSNGVVITSDRGLDLFKSPDALGVRPCRNATVVTYETDGGTVAKTFNVAASIAEEARTMLTDGFAKDVLRIEALISNDRSIKDESSQVKKMRLLMIERKVAAWLADMGITFRCGRYGSSPVDVKQFVADAEICGVDLLTKQGLLDQIKRYEIIDCISRREDQWLDDYSKADPMEEYGLCDIDDTLIEERASSVIQSLLEDEEKSAAGTNSPMRRKTSNEQPRGARG